MIKRLRLAWIISSQRRLRKHGTYIIGHGYWFVRGVKISQEFIEGMVPKRLWLWAFLGNAYANIEYE